MARRARQKDLPFPRWGGKREGAGRKAAGRSSVAHRRRPKIVGRHPILVTARLRPGLPTLRCGTNFAVIENAFTLGAERFGFRLVHYSVQSNHVHLIVEARDARALARGLQGLLVRSARGLNRRWSRRGAVFEAGYHARALKSPREVRNGLVYVLQNAHKHEPRLSGIDRFSSARWFDGWRKRVLDPGPSPLPPASTWLLATGWRRHGTISTTERPARK